MSDAVERQRLDEVVASYGEAYAPFDAAMRGYMMRTLEPHFRDGPSLQVGCAHGDQTSLLAERFGDLTVVEPARAFLDLAAARAPSSVRFVEGLIEDFETDRRFATIFFSHVLEHVEDPVACLRRLGQLLSPCGRLFVVVPNAEAASRRIAVKMAVLEHLESLSAADLEAGHRRVYRLDTLAADARRAGLAIADTGGIFFKPLANFQFDALMGGPLIGEAFMEGCYALGREHPTFCASIYLVAERRAG
jgi:2-polyprenyl-3-methyl-5-hydroxy-6-metoxy-1,4-benzoquinol methylase